MYINFQTVQVTAHYQLFTYSEDEVMRQNGYKPKTEQEMTHLFSHADIAVPSKQDTLGQIVMDIIRSGESVNRKAICSKLLARLEHSPDAEMEKHYYELIGLLFGREE